MPVAAAFSGDKQVGCGRRFSSNSVLSVKEKPLQQVKAKLVVKLPMRRVDDLLTSGKAQYFNPGHGRLMKQGAAINCPEA